MKIISLQAENIKKLVAVEITPDGNLVQITGRNGAGKTSILDSIWWALAGASHIQSVPIRKGANKARIRLDLGEIKVTRTFARKDDGDGSSTTSIVVENAEGARFPSPQTMLDSLLGELCFDPLAFARMEAKKQFDVLRRFVPDVDFDAIDNANRGDFDRRAELNRKAKEARAAASIIVIPANTPDEAVDDVGLVAALAAASETAADIERRRGNRKAMQEEANRLKTVGRVRHDEASALRERAAELDEAGSADLAKAAAIEKKIDDALPLPEPPDVVAMQAAISAARETNRHVELRTRRSQHTEAAAALEAQAKALTEARDARLAAREAAIAAAKMPVEGLTLGEGVVLLNGVPFDQASDAEQLRTSVAIATATNPKLRVIRIRDGSLLDDDAMRLLAEMADAQDMQVWIERVDSSGTIGFVIEDGALVAPQPDDEEVTG